MNSFDRQGLNEHQARMAQGERDADQAFLSTLAPEGTHQAVCDAVGKGDLLPELESLFRAPTPDNVAALHSAMQRAVDNWVELETIRLGNERD